jgi:phthalate 4,5-cis-dihydrodiol dehydrogenase
MSRKLKIAMAGLGQGAAGTLPAMDAMPELDLVAGADLNPTMRAGFEARYPGAKAYASVADLCKDPNVEAVWVATPNRFHCEHAIEAMRHGKHVIVEKPMACSMDEANRMVEVSEREGVTLLAGHTRSLSIWNRAMRRIILSGELGALRAIHIWAYTDWMIRPRTPDELDPEQGGGIVYRQGPHQIDTLRVLGGGKLRSVRGMTGRWLEQRPVPGYFTAYMEFEDGTPATIMHNGYGYFAMGSLYPWVTEKREYSDSDRAALRRGIIAGARDESKEKEDFRVGGKHDPTLNAAEAAAVPYPWKPFDLGPVEVACERGIMRPAQWGLSIGDDNGSREIDLTSLQRPEPDPSGGLSLAILGELYDAVVLGKPAYHTAAWGRATLEACLAIMESARQRREIQLQYQVEMPDSYDEDMRIDLNRTVRV